MSRIVPHITIHDGIKLDIHPDRAAIIIFGASGDLTRRKLIPALFHLYIRGLLPDNFFIFGYARSPISDDAFRETGRTALENLGSDTPKDQIDAFLSRLYYYSGHYDVEDDYADFVQRLKTLEEQYGTGNNRLFYFSVPPRLHGVIARNLCMKDVCTQDIYAKDAPWRRVIIEKPFGHDLDSSRQLARRLSKHLNEKQIYRIDHYLGKETVQNMMVFRFANAIFEPIWNRRYIDYVQITAAEDIGIEHRAGYYEQTGLLRDMFQNHLLQLLALVAIEPPASFDANVVRDEKVRLIRSIRPFDPDHLDDSIIRGQYTRGKVGGHTVNGYRDESNVSPESKIETFVAARFMIDNWRWKDVPFYIRSGKRLKRRVTEIAIHFKPVPHSMFHTLPAGSDPEPNTLIFNIQPEEGISLSIQSKHPGPKLFMTTLTMDFYYGEVYRFNLPDAYERLLLDCLLGDQTLYIRQDGLDAAWTLFTPVLKKWEEINESGGTPAPYPSGTWGPQEANRILAPNHVWREL